MFTKAKQKNVISAEEARQIKRDDSAALILDVRTPEEHRQIHIEGSLLLPLDKLPMKAAEEIPDRETLVLVYCHSGARAHQAVSILLQMGYQNVFSFGGIINWPYETITGGY